MRLMTVDPGINIGICIDGICFSEKIQSLSHLYDYIIRMSSNCDKCYIEDYAYSKLGKSSSMTAQAEMRGVIKLALENNNIPYSMININSWRAFNCWKFKKGKKNDNINYIDSARRIYGKEFLTTDEVDAYLMWRFAKHENM